MPALKVCFCLYPQRDHTYTRGRKQRGHYQWVCSSLLICTVFERLFNVIKCGGKKCHPRNAGSVSFSPGVWGHWRLVFTGPVLPEQNPSVAQKGEANKNWAVLNINKETTAASKKPHCLFPFVCFCRWIRICLVAVWWLSKRRTLTSVRHCASLCLSLKSCRQTSCSRSVTLWVGNY